MKIANNLYRPRPDEVRAEREARRRLKAALAKMKPEPPITRGARWYTAEVQRSRQELQHVLAKRGWGLAAKFPVEALEAE